jgi:hypothetical protein
MIITVGGPIQDLSNFQMALMPFLSVLNCSSHSPHDILKVSKTKIGHNLPVGRVKCDVVFLVGSLPGFWWVFGLFGCTELFNEHFEFLLGSTFKLIEHYLV